MKFCSQCDNMYYIGISIEDSNKLNYYCRNCKHKDETIAEEGICVLNTELRVGEQKFNHIINQYTKLDPTLPRIYNVKCPNMECKTNHGKNADGSDSKSEPNEVIYIRYDDDNLKYLYICVECDTTWKTNE
uniref:DNA-directed RNA polymerase M/15kDa subunit domain-containing protein n=1 Tax=viral metagenome TaxID=1070528 RepID=A0A6C0ATD8_9ZZZZ